MDNLIPIVRKYESKGILVDTELLLVLVVGLCDKNRIPNFKRTMKYSIDDFEMLVAFLKKFTKIVTTPNILTEVSNLLGQLPENLIPIYFNNYSEQIKSFGENYHSSSKLATEKAFIKFGLTDLSVIEEGKNPYLVLTADSKLWHYLTNSKIDAINFNHLRMYRWFP